ncbi:MAG: Rho termination factor N-terminal domain-containing protein [Acidobacteriota bacterium]
MEHTFDELKKKTVAELREIAKGIEHDAVQGYTQLHKDDLVKAICTALNLEMHLHHNVVGINKSDIKSKIRELKKQREAALTAHDHPQLKSVRREIHHLKRQIKKATV